MDGQVEDICCRKGVKPAGVMVLLDGHNLSNAFQVLEYQGKVSLTSRLFHVFHTMRQGSTGIQKARRVSKVAKTSIAILRKYFSFMNNM